MIVAVPGMLAVQMAADNVVGVVAVRNRLVSALLAVTMRLLVAVAGMAFNAAIGILG